MFQRWGFLLGEIWVLLALAALLGLFVGWLIWGRSSTSAADTGEADRLRNALDACATKGRDQAARITALEGEVKTANAKAHDAHLAAENARADAKAAAEASASAKSAPAALMSAPASLMSAPAKADAAPAAKAAAEPKADAKAKAPAEKAAAKVADKPKAEAKVAAPAKAKSEAKTEGAAAAPKAADKPKALDKARDGKADDLKMIKGIGPKLEILCHKLGFFHFDQIAAWTAKEIAWVDDNLEGFKGRVTRDEWVKQAAILAKGGTTEFANRVKDGDVY